MFSSNTFKQCFMCNNSSLDSQDGVFDLDEIYGFRPGAAVSMMYKWK